MPHKFFKQLHARWTQEKNSFALNNIQGLAFVLLLSIIYTSCQNFNTSDNTLSNEAYEYYAIKKFIDGDTFYLDDGTKKGVKVRLIGINAPEAHDYKHRKEEPYGKESSAYVKKLLKGKKVRLEFDVQENDKYGRVLAYVYLENGVFVNEQIVKDGFAYAAAYPPNVKHQKTLTKAQKYARKNNLGLWGGE